MHAGRGTQATESSPICEIDVEAVSEIVKDSLARSFFGTRLQMATDTEQRYLAAMASAGDAPVGRRTRSGGLWLRGWSGPRLVVEITDMRVGTKAIEEHGQDDSLSGRRWREYALQAKVVSGLSDLLALGGVVGAQLGVAELQGRAGGGVMEVEEGGESNVVAIQAPRQEVLRITALPFGEAVELADRRLTLERKIEGGEALRWIPPSAMDSGAHAREWMVVVSQMPECLTGEGGRLDRVDSSDELLIDHARLDEDALGHRVYHTQHAPELARTQQINRLMMVERIVGGKQPVVSRFGPENARELLEDHDQLQQALTSIETWSGSPR